MILKHYYITVLFVSCSLMSFGQNKGAGISTISTLISNPGTVGVEGDGTLRLSYMNVYPGNGYNLHYVQLSYDGFFEGIHGGVSAFLTSDNKAKMVNDVNGGLAYSYHFRAGENLYVSAGLAASVYYRGYNFSGAVLPDQINPVGGVNGVSREVFNNRSAVAPDLSTGILLMTDNLYGGIAVSHLTSPNMSGAGGNGNSWIDRTLLVHGGGVVKLNSANGLLINPQGSAEIRNDYYSVALGTSVENNFLSLSAIFLYDKFKNFDVLTGVAITAGGVRLLYNYCVNILSYTNLLPSTLHHQAGIAVGLNSVNKRKSVKTIKLPKI